MQKHIIKYKRDIFLWSAFGVVVLAALFLLIHAHSLSVKIANLESQLTIVREEASEQREAYCSTAFTQTRANRTTHFKMTVDGVERRYLVHTPRNYDPTVRYPMMVNFTGIDSFGNQMEGYSGINSLPVIAVYPDPLMGKDGFVAWQGAPYSQTNNDDIQFTRQILEEVPSQYCIDSANIFTTGLSNGGGFAVLAGCALSGQIKAVVSVAGAHYRNCTAQKHQPSLLSIHGTADQQVPFYGSKQKGVPNIFNWSKAEAVKRDCETYSTQRLAVGEARYSWSGCADESAVQLVEVTGQPHGWLTMPENFEAQLRKAPNITGYIWQFLSEVK